MYGYLHLWCLANFSFVYVYVKGITDEEKLVTVRYISTRQWTVLDDLRLKSFTNGPYQVIKIV